VVFDTSKAENVGTEDLGVLSEGASSFQNKVHYQFLVRNVIIYTKKSCCSVLFIAIYCKRKHECSCTMIAVRSPRIAMSYKCIMNAVNLNICFELSFI
jgi:hypothetical protein